LSRNSCCTELAPSSAAHDKNGKAAQQKFLSISPSFLVDDVLKSAKHYRDDLGFTFDRYWGGPPCFVIVSRDSVEISLANPDAKDFPRPHRKAHSQASWNA
jgi:hypothetical protein